MSPHCDKCGGHVSSNYYRVRSGNDGELHACPHCCDTATRPREAAGLDSEYRVRSTPAGYTLPKEAVSDD